ncbi:MAG: aspartate-semialdehyde dehydrogenase [Candidatus Bostrichicola ureolyticus]|nr:MAG: aspartate-semialdehyde dehydrogenase [Candidatus Bostrichicola ureolyticus]
MKLAIIGVTGMVGSVMLKVLEERNFTISKLIPVASQNSLGKEIDFRGKKYKIIDIKQAIKLNPNIALFSAGEIVSKLWAPKFAKLGTTVIDNSSAWRMDPTKKLIVPEINANLLSKDDKIIANPNCSTIQLVMVLAPLHNHYGIKRVIISTYQSVTGTGKKAVDQLKGESQKIQVKKIYPHPIYNNVLPHCDRFEKSGYTKEEIKIMQESKKILLSNNIAITATAVRVPVLGGHSESVNISFVKKISFNKILKILKNTSGVIIQDCPENNLYPMPLYVKGKDEVFVGRIRKDLSHYNSINLWIVADNLRKGAATNAIQIAEFLIKNGYYENI